MQLAVSQIYEVVMWGADKSTPLFRLAVQTFSEDDAKAEAERVFRRQCALDRVVPAIERVEVLSDKHTKPARRQQTLFEDIADLCIGHPMNDVQGAAVNLLLVGIQRRYPKLADAEARWDELMGRGREALRRRYAGAIDNRDANVAASEIGKRMIG